MQNIVPVDAGVPGPAADILAAVKQKLGKVPNILATMANAPAAVDAYLAFGAALDKGVLSAKLREQIALTVAGANECDYCASAHSFIANSLGVAADEARRNLFGESADAKTAAILRFARETVQNRANFANGASVLNELRNAGVNDAEVVEIIATIAINIFTNYFNHIAGTHVDFPLVSSTPDRSVA